MHMVAAFPFDHPKEPVSLYDYAPVLRVRDRRGDWVLKRTGLVHSDGEAIGRWLSALHGLGVDVVAPAAHLHPNPRRLDDGMAVDPRLGMARSRRLAFGKLAGGLGGREGSRIPIGLSHLRPGGVPANASR